MQSCVKACFCRSGHKYGRGQISSPRRSYGRRGNSYPRGHRTTPCARPTAPPERFNRALTKERFAVRSASFRTRRACLERSAGCLTPGAALRNRDHYRQCRRILRRLMPGLPKLKRISPFATLQLISATQKRKARRSQPPNSDLLNKERALKRLRRAASSGLPLASFLEVVFNLVNDAIPNSPNKQIMPFGDPNLEA
jgi:hypothetical protein